MSVHVTLFDFGPVNVAWVDADGNQTDRQALAPGDDISSLPDDARAAIEAHWTQERVAAYAALTE